MNRPCKISLKCDSDPDSPFVGYMSEAASPASGRCEAIRCAGVDDPFGNFSSEFEDDAEFFQDVFECGCVDDEFFLRIKAPGFIGPWVWDIIGEYPPGLVITPNFPSAGSITIVGGFTFQGHYDFKIRVTDGWGNVFEKHFVFNILKILTEDLPEPVVGVPYTFQLQAVGGSGNYAWKIIGGGLPQGLILDINGTIYGTPINPTTQTVTFRVVDTDCEAVDRTFYPASVSLVGRSTTRLATVYGYSEYIPSSPPRKYRQLTWSGFANQSYLLGVYGQPPNPVPPCLYITGGINIDYTGTSIQGDFGVDIQLRQADGSSACLSYPWLVPAGRCLCPSGPGFTFWHGQFSGVNSRDIRWSGFIYDGIGAQITSPTQLDVVGNGTKQVEMLGRVGLVTFVNDWHVQLSDEYTDAYALSLAVPVASTGLVAENFPRTTGFTSRYTDVEYDLVLEGLMTETDYEATVTIINGITGALVKTYNFTTGIGQTTHTITDTIPTPGPGSFSIVINPTVDFA